MGWAARNNGLAQAAKRGTIAPVDKTTPAQQRDKVRSESVAGMVATVFGIPRRQATIDDVRKFEGLKVQYERVLREERARVKARRDV